MEKFTRNAFSIFVLIATITIFACAPARFVKPLEKGESALGLNLGGPIIHFAGMKIPVPFSSVYYGYGISEKGSASVGLHTTALLYETLQMDFGYSYSVFEQQKLVPGISIYGGGNTMIGLRKGKFRVYPQLDVNAYWDYGSKNKLMTYVGINNWMDPHKSKVPEGSEYRFWRPSVYLGQAFRINSWELSLEYKLLGSYINNTKTVVNYATDLDFGAHGVYLNVYKKF